MQYFVNILSEIDFTQHSQKNPPINSFIHWQKFSWGKCFIDFVYSVYILQFEKSDPIINSSMQQMQKHLPVI